MIKLNKRKFFLEIILFFSSFCYLKFFNIGTNSDIQPYYFIVALLSILIIKKIDRIDFICFIILFLVFSYNLFLDYKNLFDYFKGCYSYLSFFIIFYIFYKLCTIENIKIIEKRIKLYFIIWNLVGIVQIFDNSLITFWRTRATIGNGRGSISFGSEPAYYVFFLILSSLILYLINKKNKWYFLISFFIALGLAKSFEGVFYLLIINIIIFFKKENIWKIILLLFLFIFIILLLNSIIPENNNYRILNLLKMFLDNPLELFLRDGSARVRIIHPFFSIKGSFENLFFPNGFTKWGEYVKYSLLEYSNKFYLSNDELEIISNSNFSNNINTMFGSIIYELGFVGLIFYYYIYRICLDKKIWLILMILSIDGFNITNPYLGILLGISYFLYKKNKLGDKIDEYKIFNNNTML